MLFELFDEAIISVQTKINAEKYQNAHKIKNKVHTRLESLHMCPEISIESLPLSSDVGVEVYSLYFSFFQENL